MVKIAVSFCSGPLILADNSHSGIAFLRGSSCSSFFVVLETLVEAERFATRYQESTISPSSFSPPFHSANPVYASVIDLCCLLTVDYSRILVPLSGLGKDSMDP